MKKKFGTFLSLLTIASTVVPSCIISSCRASDWSNWEISFDASGYDKQTNTIKLKNNHYNPFDTEDGWIYFILTLESPDDHFIAFEQWSLDLSNAPDFFKENIFVEKCELSYSIKIHYSTKLAILEWEEFPVTLNFIYYCDGRISPKQHFTFNVAAQKQERVYAGTLGVFTGGGNKDDSIYALTGFYDTAFNCNSQMLGNFQKLEILSDSRVRYLYDNFMNLLEDKQRWAPGLSGGVFGKIYSSYGDPHKDYEIKTKDDQKLWDWNFGTADSHTSGRWNNLIIDDYDNNPNWKQDGYKTLQIGNPYTWRSWNKMFYKCYSLLHSLHYYFDGFTNEVPIVKDGSSTGEPGTPTETYQFTPEDVDAMVYGY